jgi:hypothetical protein
MPRTAAKKPRVDTVIKDWDFSSVTKAKAKDVWIYELRRQSNVNYLAGMNKDAAVSRLLRKELTTPYSTLTPTELKRRHYWDVEPKPYFQSDGEVTDRKTGRRIFGTCGPKAKFFNLQFTFEINPHVRPRNGRKYLSRWFDSQVVPKLDLPDLRRGPKSDHISWLADLAIYRAAKAGITFGKMEKAVKHLLPLEFKAKSLFTSSTHQSDAKRRTCQRLKAIETASLFVSKFGLQS